MTAFRFIHLSDFHFSVGQGTHDERLLRALEESLRGRQFDRVLVSGDLTERGDDASLERAKGWLLDEISLSDGSSSGLHLGDFSKLRVIPGNHDAFDAPSSLRLRFWQQSVNSFYATFAEDSDLRRQGLSYEWVEKEGEALFVVYVDSCYLGGAKTTTRILAFLARTARGNVSVRQTEALLALHDRASRGELTDSQETAITASAYRKALKIVVMHHFIVAPRIKTSLRTRINMHTFMKLNQRRRVFTNLVLADVGMLLCGHSHLGELQDIAIGEQLDRRARARYTMNMIRRHLGLPTDPLRSGGTRIGKKEAFLLHVLRSAQAQDPDDLRSFNELLDQLLRGETNIQQQLVDHLADDRGLGKEISAAEVELLCRSVEALGKPRRKELRRIAQDMFRSAKRFQHSRFLQAMNGSSAKAWDETKKRIYFEYEITRDSAGQWQVMTTRYEYQDSKGFLPKPPVPFSPNQ